MGHSGTAAAAAAAALSELEEDLFIPESNEQAHPAAAGQQLVRGGRTVVGCVAS